MWQSNETEIRLGELPLRPLAVVSESDGVASVARTMLDRRVSCAVLAERPLRVVTEHDLARAWALERTGDDEIAAVATSHPYWAAASTTVAEAAAMMVHLGVRHLVVVDDADRPIGVVTMTELFSVLVQSREPAQLYRGFAAVLLQSGQTVRPE